MSNYKRPVITWGNDFTINIALQQFIEGEYVDFNLTTVKSLEVYLLCATHNQKIPLDWEILEGYDYIISCFVDYRVTHPNTSYGICVEGEDANDKHFRWYMAPKEGILVINNTSGQNIPQDVQVIDLSGRVGWGITTDAYLTNYYTKEQTNNLLSNAIGEPIICEVFDELDPVEIADAIKQGQYILLKENDGNYLNLSEYNLRYDAEEVILLKWYSKYIDVDGVVTLEGYQWTNTDDPDEAWEIIETALSPTTNTLVNWDGMVVEETIGEELSYTYSIPNKTYAELLQAIKAGKIINLTFYLGILNQTTHEYEPNTSAPLLTALSGLNLLTLYFYSVNYHHFELEGQIDDKFKIVAFEVRMGTPVHQGALDGPIILIPHETELLKLQEDVDTNKTKINNMELSAGSTPTRGTRSAPLNQIKLQTTDTGTTEVLSTLLVKTINNESILGSGNIEIQGGGATGSFTQEQADWNQTDDTQPDYIKNKPDMAQYAGMVNLNTLAKSTISDIINIETSIKELSNSTDSKVNEVKNELTEVEEITAKALNDLNNRINSGATGINQQLNNKQDTLVSGQNIKTINGQTILGSGNITIEGGGATGSFTQEQADWNQTDDTQPDYIKNKPDMAQYAGMVNLNTLAKSTISDIINIETSIKELSNSTDSKVNEVKNELTNTNNNLSEVEEITAKALNDLNNRINSSATGTMPTNYVESFNGETGAVTYTAPVTSVNGMTGAVTIQAGGDPGFIKVTNGNNVGLVSSLTTVYNSSIGNHAVIEGDGYGSDIIKASGYLSHAEGYATQANSDYSHAEGYKTQANGTVAHAEGYGTRAVAYAHAEGRESMAVGYYSHAGGLGTYANNNSEHALGQYNVSTKTNTTFGDAGNTLFSVGNGTNSNTSSRHNAFEIRQNGDIYLNDGSHPISSTTNGLKIEVTSALPASPDANTIYICTSNS